jgi:hypothetical protein
VNARLTRTAVTSTLRVARVPWDLATKVLPGGDSGLRAGVSGTIDLADATLRRTAGRLLRDDELVADGQRRKIALDQRREAARLRADAEAARAGAEAAAARERDAVANKRREIEEQADADQERIARAEADREAEIARAAAGREQAIDAERDRQQAAVEKGAKRARLAVIEDEADAVGAAADAATAADEAARLRDAASKAKAVRKQA